MAIKYNMIYISTYQVIKMNIECNTAWGQKLVALKRAKDVDASLDVRDEFKESEFSPVHYPLQEVMTLLKETIAQKRTN
mgnify:CR=1 FL=1